MRARMLERGTFVVDDDPHGVLAVALAIATSPRNAPRCHRALAPCGEGS
jgi:hypothetical protein